MSIKLEVSEPPPQSLEEILKKIFWKEPDVAEKARDFLQHIKEWSRTETPYTVDQWKQYTVKTGITQSTYSNMLKRLKNAGMIKKTYNKGRGKHELHINKTFSDSLYTMYTLWEGFTKE
jgi:DNA-binding transcriptional ArsR family regulator